MPVWHASVSIRNQQGNPVQMSTHLKCIKRAGIAACAGVGNYREWWVYNKQLGIGHLRVGVTLEEYGQLGHYVAIADAGPAGPERPRTPYRGQARI
jgi:hypothetical protein